MNTGTAILEAFYQAAGQFVRADDLGRQLNQPATMVTAEIVELEKLGYTIEAHPHLGYRLLGTPNRLTGDDIKARLKSRLIGSEILVFEETASTNDVVEHLAKSGAREGLVVFAESQTRGRGRRGRAWMSPRGKGLWFSVLLRPTLPPAAASRITVAASVAVARAIRQNCGVDARIKWPNDVIVNGKKLAGILVEAKLSTPPRHGSVIDSMEESPNESCGGTGVPACGLSGQGVRNFITTRRNLPHWQEPGSIYFVTFRVCKGGLLTEEMRDAVLQACCFWHGQRYHLYAVTIMPDHVHLLLWPQPIDHSSPAAVAEKGFHALSDIMHGLKSFTAHEIQRHCGWRGAVWMDESFDRIVRDDDEFSEKWNYIAQNAVKKGLVSDIQEYRWFWHATEPSNGESTMRSQAGTPVPPSELGMRVPAPQVASAGPPFPSHYVVLGIGIDVNCQREDFSSDLADIATSLELETRIAQDRVALAAQVLTALDECYRVALTNFETIADEWAKLCTTLGKHIVVTMGQRRIEGFAQALDDDGALLLRRDSGQVERILAGDVVVERA
jgi:biotin-(acetyl-CoA carboxylase) ligase/biotin operon repressor/REP element-mobilizing transposase RayT